MAKSKHSTDPISKRVDGRILYFYREDESLYLDFSLIDDPQECKRVYNATMRTFNLPASDPTHMTLAVPPNYHADVLSSFSTSKDITEDHVRIALGKPVKNPEKLTVSRGLFSADKTAQAAIDLEKWIDEENPQKALRKLFQEQVRRRNTQQKWDLS